MIHLQEGKAITGSHAASDTVMMGLRDKTPLWLFGMLHQLRIMNQRSKSAKGILLGIVAAVSYGTNPLFAVPLYDDGLTVSSVLFYRYAIATVLLGMIMLLRHESFRLGGRELAIMVGMGIMFAFSSVFLFEAYNYMDVGLASTLLFMEPVFIVLILRLFCHERIKAAALISVAVCISGVICLCNPGEGAYVTLTGVLMVLLSSLSYAIYMVAINKTRIRQVSSMSITFYSLLFGQLVFAASTRLYTTLQGVPSGAVAWTCVLGVSVIPTIISLLAVAVAVKHIGSVAVAILGAFEPVTGLLVGSMLFGETITPRAILGILLILSSVIVIIKSTAKG